MNSNFDRYLKNSLTKLAELNYNGSPDVIVIIPAINEPNIFDTYNSLLQTERCCSVLVLTVVNYSEKADLRTKEFNQELYHKIQSWNDFHSSSEIVFKVLMAADVRRKHAGAGYARKVGMDTATEVFYSAKNERGIIISLDADCLVAPNYFKSIFSKFESDEKIDLQVIDFEHQKKGLETQQLAAIIQYETYLHYFVVATRMTGFPYAYHTIGSTFALTVNAYVKNGGMNRKHAGEDFYFLHKIFPNALVNRNYQTKVYPSSRVSDRVPFGTGPALSQILNNEGHYLVYNPQAFADLKVFFDHFNQFFENYFMDRNQLASGLRDFLETINFDETIEEAMQNSANFKSFKRRLFMHFDAFQIVKFLNFTHENGYYEKLPVSTACQKMFGIEVDEKNNKLLEKVRKLEQQANPH
jgi:hypothetical protein